MNSNLQVLQTEPNDYICINGKDNFMVVRESVSSNQVHYDPVHYDGNKALTTTCSSGLLYTRTCNQKDPSS